MSFLKLKRYISLILAVLISLSCMSGCKDGEQNVSSGSEATTGGDSASLDNFDILYCTRDYFDPYTCKTKQNFELSYLLFDPLVKLDNNFNAVNVLASSVSISGKLCTVTLKDAKFTDGTDVTAEDVVFSFNKAKASSTVHHYSLQNAVSIKETGNKSVSITLTKSDPYFMNVLDFPILKKGSDQLKNSDNKSLPPIGSGRYLFDEDMTSLVYNPNYHGGEVKLKKIGLVDSPDTEADIHNIEIGVVDYYYSNLEDGTFPKMNGAKADVSLNNLVYLGVNQSNKYLGNILFRQALSSALNRSEISTKSYFSNARPALGPYPTVWEPAKDYQTITATANTEISQRNIADAGYTKKDSDGFYLGGSRRISLRLLVNNDNEVRVSAAEQIAEQLKNFGIQIVVEKVSVNDYTSRINQKNYDLYLGEARLSLNMDLSELINFIAPRGYNSGNTSGTSSSSSSSPSTSSGGASSSNTSSGSTSKTASAVTSSGDSSQPADSSQPDVTTAEAINKFYSGEYTIGDLATVFNSELPVIPICHRTGLAVYSSAIKANLVPSVSDLFFGFENIQ